jgi:hypothetical protein
MFKLLFFLLGELKGLFELHKQYGKLDWKEVVQPAIQVAKNGFKLSKYLENVFEARGDKIRESLVMRFVLRTTISTLVICKIVLNFSVISLLIKIPEIFLRKEML